MGSKTIRVLQIAGAMNRAGTETMLMNLYRKIDKNKYQFDFVSYSSEKSHYDEEIESYGGKIIRLTNPLSIKQLVAAIKVYGPYDVVHSHTLFHCGIANSAAKIAGVKVRIAHAHTTDDNKASLVRKTYLNSMRQLIHLSSTHYLACSQNAGYFLYGKKAEQSSKYSYFPNSIDFHPFLEPPADEKIKQIKTKYEIENHLVVGHIGRFIKPKNHLFLLEITSELVKQEPLTKLLLIGEGEEKRTIKQKAKELGLEKNIIFAGLLADVAPLLHCMDVFVFPSIYEGLGLVLLEAQATGLPCVVSDAIQEEADLNLGLITKTALTESPNAWANQILNVAGNKQTDAIKITQAFIHKNYTIPCSLKKLSSIYQNHNGGSHEKYIDHLI
ncbi:glycosyltransferase family 1 protein [Jeotgalibacillus sp. ET6]|uniref:glycosyltransferase family 1 protein n=1 Tax=Jeotgalibacillus sp. ET6 TaxID=3037260 RepID=UPI00241839F5|nr:glycosyltransferase family 1 protein [Jeotgalibacillus sp. ET6]MDG5472613.1 glycosyltransferase family 1 protein [Jeotgalibacillus sp. ET6]